MGNSKRGRIKALKAEQSQSFINECCREDIEAANAKRQSALFEKLVRAGIIVREYGYENAGLLEGTTD